MPLPVEGQDLTPPQAPQGDFIQAPPTPPQLPPGTKLPMQTGERVELPPGTQITNTILGPANQEARKYLPGLAADILVPPDFTTAAIEGASLLAPEVPFVGSAARAFGPRLLKAGKRALAMAGTGAAAATQEGNRTALGGATQGAVGAITERIPIAVARRFYASKLGQRLADLDPSELGRVLGQIVPALRTGRGSTVQDIQNVAWGSLGAERLSDMFEQETGQLAAQVGGPIPKGTSWQFADQNFGGPRAAIQQAQGGLGTSGPLSEAVNMIARLRKIGRTPEGDPKAGAGGLNVSDLAEDIAKEVAGHLRRVDPTGGLSQQFSAMNDAYRKGFEMIRYVAQKDLVGPNGELNMAALQSALKEGSRKGLQHDLDPAEFQALQNVIFRGAGATAEDVVAEASVPRVYAHPGNIGHLPTLTAYMNMARGPKFAGSENVLRSQMGRGANAATSSKVVGPAIAGAEGRMFRGEPQEGQKLPVLLPNGKTRDQMVTQLSRKVGKGVDPKLIEEEVDRWISANGP